MTDVEQEEMDTIIADGIQDAKKSGVECKIEKKVMSFYGFVQEYGEPYGVTVESLLTKPVAESRPPDRQHSAPEREAAETTKAVRAKQQTTCAVEPEPEIALATGAPAPTWSTVAEWLEATKLTVCQAALEAAGYDDELIEVVEADEEEVVDIIAAVEGIEGIQKPKLRRFKRGLAKVRGKGEAFA